MSIWASLIAPRDTPKWSVTQDIHPPSRTEACRRGQRSQADARTKKAQEEILSCFENGCGLSAKQIAVKLNHKKANGNLWRHLNAMTEKGLLIQTYGIGSKKQKTITFRRSEQ